MRKIINKGKTLIWDDYKLKFHSEICILYELTDRLFITLGNLSYPQKDHSRNIYCYNKQTGKKIWKIARSIDENGKLIGNGYLGIGINITQDNGELIDIDELLTMEQYQTLYKSFESEYDNFRHIPFLDRAFNPTKDKLIAECANNGARFDYWVDWETGKVELFDILSRY
ncbi:hypothetical protein [uncultured Gammaproteobacteria bacterium]|jgi:hypothetical protein|nr:hypothetical protein [uncultured Gammaproteobacteria bacterium]